MLTQAMFYSIEQQSKVVGVTEEKLHLHYACLQAAYFYRQNMRVFIYTQDQQSEVPNFANQYSHLIDFVPTDDALKEQARNRFRTCRQWGFNVEHQVASTTKTIDTTS